MKLRDFISELGMDIEDLPKLVNDADMDVLVEIDVLIDIASVQFDYANNRVIIVTNY